MGRIKTTRKKTWYTFYISIAIFIVVYAVVYIISISMEEKYPLASTINSIEILSFMIALISSVGFLYGRIKLLWDKIKLEIDDVRTQRLIHHYNLCLKYINTNQYDKAVKVYKDIFQGTNKPTEYILRVMLKVYKGKSLIDEYLPKN